MIPRKLISRLERLEIGGAFRIPRVFPPLNSLEIAAIIKKLWSGMRLDSDEIERLENETPVLHGEYLISTHNRKVIAKRYVGINVATEF